MGRFPRDLNAVTIAYSYRDFLRSLWSSIRPYRGLFFAASFFRVTSDAVWLFPAYALSEIISLLSKGITDDTGHRVTTIGILWALATIWRLVGQYFTKVLGFRVAERAALDAQLNVTRRLFQLDMSWHERENAGNKLKRIDRGAMAISRVIRFWFGGIIEILVNVVGMVFIISRITPGMGISMMSFVLVFLGLSAWLTKYASAMEVVVDKKEEDIQGLTFESINNIRTVKALDMITVMGERLAREIGDLFGKVKKRIGRFQTRSLVLSTWGQWFRLISLFVIIYGIIQGHYSLGFLVLFNAYFNRLWESVADISELAPDIVAAKYALGRMEEINREPVRIDSVDGKQTFPPHWEQLEVKHLSFSYGQTEVLHDLSFTVRRGERVGIVGLSGAGKSTLFKLLMKEHENYRGEINIDATPLPTIEKQSYLARVASVLQETEVFNFSLRENITIANPNQQPSVLDQALTVAHVAEFIHKLPAGLETLIGEKGFRLSGGEKQRVGLARAIYKQPEILLLDEATSHLDLESEQDIQDSLHHFFQSVTAIVIAHRLTTIKEMDRILVIEGGRLIESGTFDELQAKRGRFFDLWERQRL